MKEFIKNNKLLFAFFITFLLLACISSFISLVSNFDFIVFLFLWLVAFFSSYLLRKSPSNSNNNSFNSSKIIGALGLAVSIPALVGLTYAIVNPLLGDAKEGRNLAEKKMTPQQIEKAQVMARNWKPASDQPWTSAQVTNEEVTHVIPIARRENSPYPAPFDSKGYPDKKNSIDVNYTNIINGMKVSATWEPIDTYSKAIVGEAVIKFTNNDGMKFSVYSSSFGISGKKREKLEQDLNLEWWSNGDNDGFKFKKKPMHFEYKAPNFGGDSDIISQFSGLEEPFFFYDLDFDGNNELIVVLYGAGQRGSDIFKVYALKDGMLVNKQEQITDNEPYLELDGLSKINIDDKTINIHSSGGACNNYNKTYRFFSPQDNNKKGKYILEKYSLREMKDGSCKQYTYSVEPPEDCSDWTSQEIAGDFIHKNLTIEKSPEKISEKMIYFKKLADQIPNNCLIDFTESVQLENDKSTNLLLDQKCSVIHSLIAMLNASKINYIRTVRIHGCLFGITFQPPQSELHPYFMDPFWIDNKWVWRNRTTGKLLSYPDQKDCQYPQPFGLPCVGDKPPVPYAKGKVFPWKPWEPSQDRKKATLDIPSSTPDPSPKFSKFNGEDNFFTEFSETEKDKMCGGIKYSILNLGAGGFGGHRDHIKIRVFNEKRESVFEGDSTSSLNLGCRDITNDGVPELIVDTLGGGNCGCCNTFFALTTKQLEGKSHLKVLLQEEGLTRIEDIDDDGISEIIACQWAGYGEKGNIYLDKTLCLKDGKYVECQPKKNEQKNSKTTGAKKEGFKVTLGIFETKILAEKFKAKLLKKGLSPNIEQKQNEWELFIGPYPSEEAARQAKSSFNEDELKKNALNYFDSLIADLNQHDQKHIQSEPHKTSPFQQKSLSSHIKHLNDCGIDNENIDIKRDLDGVSFNPLIAYVIDSSSIDVECLVSSKLKTKPIIKQNVPFFFKSLIDSGVAETTYPLDEGLIKLNDRVIIFSAPTSDVGVKEIKVVSDKYIVVKTATHTYSSNFLVATDTMKINYLSQGAISVVDKNKLIFKASGRKGYFKDSGGAFWYDSLIDKTGKLIGIINTEDEQYTKCYSREEFFEKSDMERLDDSALIGFNAPRKICVIR